MSVVTPAEWEYQVPTRRVPLGGFPPSLHSCLGHKAGLKFNTIKPGRAFGEQRHITNMRYYFCSRVNQAFQESLASYVRRQRDVMGRACGCPGGVFPGEGPRPSARPCQALQPLRSSLGTLSAACWRAQASASYVSTWALAQRLVATSHGRIQVSLS